MLPPRDERDVCEAVAEAAAGGRALEILGGGTKLGVGAPDRGADQLSMCALSRVIDYDPAELVLTVEPGALLNDIEALLAGHSQMLAFEPWDFAETVGGAPGQSTIGGVVASGLAGPRRLSAGGVRDHLLGFTAVNGRGELFKAGGRVVKNVTGYDLSKLMAGSWGRLCALTQMTLKVLPRPMETRTLVLRGLSHAAGVDTMGKAMRAPADIAAASFASADGDGVSRTALRLEGFGPSIEARTRLLAGLLADAGRVETLLPEEADTLWRKVRAGRVSRAGELPLLWRMVVPPARGAEMLAEIERFGGAGMMDWGGGLVWARSLAEAAGVMREAAEHAGGHAMLIGAPEEVRRDVPALHPEAPGVAALSRRVREAFDPQGVFSPDRFEVPA